MIIRRAGIVTYQFVESIQKCKWDHRIVAPNDYGQGSGFLHVASEIHELTIHFSHISRRQI